MKIYMTSRYPESPNTVDWCAASSSSATVYRLAAENPLARTGVAMYIWGSETVGGSPSQCCWGEDIPRRDGRDALPLFRAH